jgi:hypothetical protein
MTANSVEAEKWFYVVDSHAKRHSVQGSCFPGRSAIRAPSNDESALRALSQRSHVCGGPNFTPSGI